MSKFKNLFSGLGFISDILQILSFVGVTSAVAVAALVGLWAHIRQIPDVEVFVISIFSFALVIWSVVGVKVLLLDKGKVKFTPLKQVFEQKYLNTKIDVDGKHFIRCRFENVTLKFNGGYYKFEDCEIIPNRMMVINTIEPKVASTLSLLKLFKVNAEESTLQRVKPDEKEDK